MVSDLAEIGRNFELNYQASAAVKVFIFPL